MESERQITRRDLVNIIFRNKRKIIIVTLISFIVATAGSYLWPKTYTAESKLLIKLGREISPLPSGFSGGTVMVTKREEDTNSEIEILKSASLIKKVLIMMDSDFHKVKNPVTFMDKVKQEVSKIAMSVKKGFENLLVYVGLISRVSPAEKLLMKVQKKLEVEPLPLTDVISVSFTWDDPKITANFVKNLVSQYLDYHLKILHNTKTLDFFVEQVVVLKNKLETSRNKLLEFKKSHGLTQFEVEKSQLLKQVEAYTASTQNLFSEIKKTQVMIIALKSRFESIPREILLSNEDAHNSLALSYLERQLADLMIKEQDLINKYYKNNPQVKTVQSQIELLKKQVGTEKNSVYGSTVHGVNKNWMDLRLLLIKSESTCAALKAKYDEEIKSLQVLQNRLKELRNIENAYLLLDQQVEIDNKNYLLYENKMEQSRIEVAMDADKLTSVRIIQPARTPTKPISPKKVLIILLSVIMGILGGTALSFFIEYMDTSISTPVEIENIGIQFLGTIMENE